MEDDVEKMVWWESNGLQRNHRNFLQGERGPMAWRSVEKGHETRSESSFGFSSESISSIQCPNSGSFLGREVNRPGWRSSAGQA